jgi:hypothetical protein
MKNGRCRMHGGKSTGPKTEEGRKRCSEARLVHGRYTKEAKKSRSGFEMLLRLHAWVQDMLQENERLQKELGLK